MGGSMTVFVESMEKFLPFGGKSDEKFVVYTQKQCGEGGLIFLA
jgi:hypothetical protein